jgi:hypothetical protein
MQRVELDTAVFDFVEPRVLRVRVAEGVEIDTRLAMQYRATVTQLVSGPTGLLVDKQHRYSLTFDAQYEVLSRLPQIVATALLVRSSLSAQVAQSQLPILRRPEHPVDVFGDAAAALTWLRGCLDSA